MSAWVGAVAAALAGGALAALVRPAPREEETHHPALAAEPAQRVLAPAGWFEPNAGQWPRATAMSYSSPGVAARLTARGIEVAPADGWLGASSGPPALRIEFVGAAAHAEWAGEGGRGPDVSYLLGADLEHHIGGIRTSRSARWRDAYPGVDVVCHAAPGGLEYTFDASGGGDLSSVRVRLRGARSIRKLASGELKIRTARTTLRQSAPLALEDVAVECAYRVLSRDTFGLTLDADFAGVVDPVLRFSAPAGGFGANRATAVAVDDQGKLYVAGDSTSPSLELLGQRRRASGRKRNVWVAKLDPVRSQLEYLTFLGGRRDEFASDLAVRPDGSAIVVGRTDSADFPVRAPFETHIEDSTTTLTSKDGFVTRLAPDGGDVAFSTYLARVGVDAANAIALAPSGDVVVAGTIGLLDERDESCSCGPFDDVRIVRISGTTDTLLSSTVIGGLGVDEALGVTVGSDDVAYVVGETKSADFPVTPGSPPFGESSPDGRVLDGFAMSVDSAGQIGFARFLGGSGFDSAEACALDSAGVLHVAGRTSSLNFATLNAIQPTHGGGTFSFDGFVAGLSTPSGEVLYSSYFGGSQQDSLSAIAVGADDSIYVGGSVSFGVDFVDAVQALDYSEALVARLAPGASSVIYATPLGGHFGSDVATGLVVLPPSSVVAVGIGGFDFPRVSALRLRGRPSRNAGFVAVIDDDGEPEALRVSVDEGRVRFRDGTASALLRLRLAAVPGLAEEVTDPSQSDMFLAIAGGSAELAWTVPALDPAWRRKRGDVWVWEGATTPAGTGRLVYNARRGKLTASLSAVAPAVGFDDLIRVDMRLGAAAGSYRSTWSLEDERIRFWRR